MPNRGSVDATDARILLALAEQPRLTTVALAERLGLSRNTVQARLAALDEVLESFEKRIDPASIGYPLTAFVTARLVQRELDAVAEALEEIPEVLQVQGLSGETDLLIHVVATDADDLYRIAGRILAIPGVERTSTSLVMRELVNFRVHPLLRRSADTAPRRR
jgi:DNA-binding Lrp family transcriptional regulator